MQTEILKSFLPHRRWRKIYKVCPVTLRMIIKALTALVGRLSLSWCWGNGPERGLQHLTFWKFKQTVQNPIRRRVLWRLIWVCTVCQYPSSLLTLHSGITSTRPARLQITVTWISYKRVVWFHWSMIITWTITIRNFWYLYILWVDCEQSTRK